MDEFQVTNLFLLDLPTELVQRILEALDIHSLATCAQVSAQTSFIFVSLLTVSCQDLPIPSQPNRFDSFYPTQNRTRRKWVGEWSSQLPDHL
jgi:hypothetical protein